MHFGSYFHLCKKSENHCKTEWIFSPVPSGVFSLTLTMCNTRQQGNSCSKMFFPAGLPAAAHRPLSTVGICSGLVPAALAKMVMKTTEWETSGMWKCWCPNWWNTRTARILSWLCFLLVCDRTFIKVRWGLLKIPIIFWQKAHCIITLRFSHKACPHSKF